MPQMIRVTVHTGARHENVEQVGIDEYKVWITEVPEHGKANEALIDLLSIHFDKPVSNIRIRSGSRSRHKWIEIS